MFQLMEEDLLEQYDAPMLRFEVSRSGAKFKRGLSDEVKGSNKEILKTVMNESEKTIHSYKELQRYSEKYKIPPEQDQCGIYGFPKVKFCKLHNFIYKEQKNSKFSSAPYCSSYVSPREMYMLLLNLVIFLCYLRKCRNIFLYGMECTRFIAVNITPICVQNRLPRKQFRLLFIMPTRKHKGRRTTIADGSPAVWGKKRCQMRPMM